MDFPPCAALPALPTVHVGDARYIRVVNKLSSRGAKQKRVFMVRPHALVLASPQQGGEWVLSRYVQFAALREVVVGSDCILFKAANTTDLLLYMTHDRRNISPLDMGVLLTMVRRYAEAASPSTQLSVVWLKSGENIKTFANHTKPDKHVTARQQLQAFAKEKNTPSPKAPNGITMQRTPPPPPPPPASVKTVSVRDGDTDEGSSSSQSTPPPSEVVTLLIQKEANEATGMELTEGLVLRGVHDAAAAAEGAWGCVGWRVTHVSHREVRSLGEVLAAAEGEEVLSVTLRGRSAGGGGGGGGSSPEGRRSSTAHQEREDDAHTEASLAKDVFIRELLAENAHLAAQLHERTAATAELTLLCKHMNAQIEQQKRQLSRDVSSVGTATDTVEAETHRGEQVEDVDKAAAAVCHERCNYRLSLMQQEKRNLRDAITALKQQVSILSERYQNRP